MSRSVSEKCETNLNIRFTKKQQKFVKWMSRSVSEKYETDLDIYFTKKNSKMDIEIRFTLFFQPPRKVKYLLGSKL